MDNDIDKIGSTVKSAAGNLFSTFIIVVGVAFLVGIPVGRAARDFSSTMFNPNITVPNDK